MDNQQPVAKKKTNGLCIAGLILAFLLPLVGFILSIVGTVKASKNNESSVCGIIGIIFGAINTFVLPIILSFLFTFLIMPNIQNNIVLQTACSNIDANGNYGEKGDEVYCKHFVCETNVNGRYESKNCAGDR